MTIERVYVPGVPQYTPVTISTGRRTIHIPGQVAHTPDGQLIGGDDLAAQTEAAYRNLGLTLQGVGASFSDLVRVTAYVVDWDLSKLQGFAEGSVRAAAALGMEPPPLGTMAGVAKLAWPDLLIEVEAVAVLD